MIRIKYILSIVLLSFIINVLSNAQEVNVSFKIVSKEEKTPTSLFKKKVPYLVIIYHNQTDNDVYFPSLFSSLTSIPQFPIGFLRSEGDASWEATMHYLKNSERWRDYRLCLWPASTKEPESTSMEVYIDYYKRYGEDRVFNYYLSNYYEIVYGKKSRSDELFLVEELENINNIRRSESFVFLKKGETVSQSINLSAFVYTNITVHIHVDPFSFPITMLALKDTEKGGIAIDYPLPESIESFHLLKRDFNVTTYAIDFSKIKH